MLLWPRCSTNPRLLLEHAELIGTAAAAAALAAPQQQHHHHQPAWRQHACARAASTSSSSSSPADAGGNIDGKLGADPDEVADLIEGNIYRPTRAERQQQRESAPTRLLLTTRREALSLYREVLRYSNLFVWRDEHGRLWRDVIRSSARQEFEAARREPDPELINRMIVTGRDALQRTVSGFLAKRQRIIDEEAGSPQVPPL